LVLGQIEKSFKNQIFEVLQKKPSLRGGFPRQVRGEVNLPPGGSEVRKKGRKEERKKERNEEGRKGG
jgi:hypothetical protein